MTKKCIICYKKIKEIYGKLKGSILKVRDENNKNQFIYVCSDCQKKEDWINIAKIKGV